MGTAQVIVGQMPDGTMNTNAGSNAFAYGDQVYIMADPKDEYEVKVVTYVDGSGTRQELSAPQDITLPDESIVKVYTFTMPDYDVTVTVTFEEPISSKLRLSKLRVFADETQSKLKPTTPDPAEYMIWQKSFTEEELNDAANQPDERSQGRYLANKGTAITMGSTSDTEKELIDNSVLQYLVVIPYEADYSQVEVTLRQVVNTLNGQNPNLPIGTGDRVEILMTLYPDDPITDTGVNIYSGTGSTYDALLKGPTTHTSDSFLSPQPGSSSYVEVQVSYNDGTTTIGRRYYYVEIHRRPKDPIATLNYGNSPYGMIMNADNIADADKAAAKAAFVANNYSFAGLDPAYVPDAVSRADAAAGGGEIKLSSIHYWTEAWVAPDAVYEPESKTGYIYNSTQGIWVPDPAVYKASENLDLSDTAFFAIMGEEFLDPGMSGALDSTGRPADLSGATISLTAYTLNIDAVTQLERFGLPDDPVAAGCEVTLSRNRLIGQLVDSTWAVGEEGKVNLRPGRYQLAYTYPDYDNAEDNPSFLVKKRDFVVLAPVGDVDADRVLTNIADQSTGSDEALMKERVTAPLGYLAENYPDGAIHKLRTCDVNNDRNINNIDANGIRTKKHNGVQKYYLPVDYK